MESSEISPIDANFMSSDSSRPLAGPLLGRSPPYFSSASLNFLSCEIEEIDELGIVQNNAESKCAGKHESD